MSNKTRTILLLISSFGIFSVGMYRILIESPMSLFGAYILAISGLIGVIYNGIILGKSYKNYRKE